LNSPQPTDPTTTYLADLLEDTREELARADSKAALLLAGAGVVVGALLAGLLGGRWTPSELDNRVEWVWWLGIASTAAGIFSIAAVVYPHIRRRDAPLPPIPSYFGDVAAYKDIQTFRRAVEHVPSYQERLIDQTFVVSRLVERKYVLLRRGLRFLLLAISACSAAIIINIPLSR
jgi:MFS family permease